MKYKVIIGPEYFVVSRHEFKSEPISIGNEYIHKNSNIVLETYKEQVHENAKEYITLKRKHRYAMWRELEKGAEAYLELIKSPDINHTLYFDGPIGRVSIVPWKQAKYGEWFWLSLKKYNLLKKKYLQS